MKKLNLFLRSVLLISIVFIPLLLLDSCSFCTSTQNFFCSLLSTTKTAEITDSSSAIVIMAQDSLAVYHGSACAKSDKSGGEDILKLDGMREFPAFVDSAIVFLNGWDLQYLGGDHHVGGMGVVIKNIRLERSPETRVLALKWEAAGVLSDKNFDDSYSMCYNYTVVAWSGKSINMNIDQDDGACSGTDPVTSNFFSTDNSGTTTSLSHRSFLYNPAFEGSPEVAILPRGFGMGWTGCDVDHHLLQIAYNLDHSAPFIKNQSYKNADKTFNPSFTDKTAMADTAFVTWESQAIFKDNDGRRGYEFGEIVTGLGGSDVSLIDPPYSILPYEDDCDGGVGQTSPEEGIIKNIPFRFAIPVLTGWDMGYLCDDEHIMKAGVWIESWSYTKDPLTNSGTLTYKLNSNLSDKNADNSNFRSHNISILGIKSLLPVTTSKSTVDLLPVIPPGSEQNTFCRRDPQGNFLFVTIKNQGSTDAGPSVTSVAFGDQTISVNTPPVKAGESTELQFRIPGNCFDPDCEFTIIADSQKQIEEGSGEMNNNVRDFCKRVIL